MSKTIENHTGKHKLDNQVVSARHNYIFILPIIIVYVLLALTYSLLTPAWEANDEYDHTLYVEYIVDHHSLPHIAIVNGDESHQPPLYYVSAALWQNLLHIPHFQLKRPTAIYSVSPKPHLSVSHDYTATERKAAVYLHELRILSIIFGAGTVFFTFWAAEIITKRLSVSLAAASFVALLPKEIVVTSVVTNDSLVIMLCSLALALILKWFYCKDRKQRLIIVGALGITLGAAAITKFNSLSLVSLYLIIILALSIKSKNWREPLVAIAGFLLVSGWWFYHNLISYGDILATKASNSYLDKLIPGLIKPLPLHLVPKYLKGSVWYDGGWNQLLLTPWIDTFLAIFAAVSLAGAVWYLFARNRKANFAKSYVKNRVVSSILLLSVASGLAVLLVIAHDNHQAEGRVTYVGLSAFAICVTIGITYLLQMVSVKLKYVGLLIWPIVFAVLNVYIITHFIYPLSGL